MNPKQKKYNFQDKEVLGQEIDFETEKEDWNVYILKDGTKLKMKSVISTIVRLEDYKQDTGDPIYLVTASNVIIPDVPERLKKKPKGGL